MAVDSQNNILITQDGQACLGDFGITGAFERFFADMCGADAVRYMAPECVLATGTYIDKENMPSKESDVYSLALTSFVVRSSIVNHPRYLT